MAGPGPLRQLRSRTTWRRHRLAEVGRDVGHRFLLTVVTVFLFGLLLRVALG